MLERVWRKGNPLALSMGCKLIEPLWRTVWRFLKKLKIEVPYDPAIPLLGIYPEKTIIQKESCTTIFIAALFTIARTWKQPKCPSTHFIIFLIFKLIFWLHWVFVAACRLSLVAASGGYSSLRCVAFSLRWLLLLQSMGSRALGLQ